MSVWSIISSLSGELNEDQIKSLERNSQIGLLALHFASNEKVFLESSEFASEIRPRALEICRNAGFPNITIKDISFILSLSYLIHLSIHKKNSNNGTWTNLRSKPAVCEWPGCVSCPTDKDHIWPNSLGGPYENWNLQWLCKFHNIMKSNSPVFAFNNSNDFQIQFKSWMDAQGYYF